MTPAPRTSLRRITDTHGGVCRGVGSCHEPPSTRGSSLSPQTTGTLLFQHGVTAHGIWSVHAVDNCCVLCGSLCGMRRNVTARASRRSSYRSDLPPPVFRGAPCGRRPILSSWPSAMFFAEPRWTCDFYRTYHITVKSYHRYDLTSIRLGAVPP